MAMHTCNTIGTLEKYMHDNNVTLDDIRNCRWEVTETMEKDSFILVSKGSILKPTKMSLFLYYDVIVDGETVAVEETLASLTKIKQL